MLEYKREYRELHYSLTELEQEYGVTINRDELSPLGREIFDIDPPDELFSI